MELKAKKVPIGKVTFCEKNVRRHPAKQIEALKESYRLFGQYRPLVADFNGVVLVGNGMLKALQELGAKDVEVKFLPADFPEDMKKKLMLADNKTQAIGIDDLGNIEEIMLELPDFNIPGYEADILEELYGEIESVDEFNVLPQEAVAAKLATSAKREEEGVESVSAAQYNRQIDEQPFENPENTPGEQHAGNYVTCPNCGLKIWR